MLRAEVETTVGAIELQAQLDVEAGECLALAGPSGAGKTSVLRAIAGLLQPRRGVVKCAGETWLDTVRGVSLPPEERRCGYVFQEYALFPRMTARANVEYAMADRPRVERRERAGEALARLGLEARAEVRPGELSGGERQRVALARALARRPAALLLDEPLSALDARTRAGAAAALAEAIRDSGAPAVLVTHDFAEAAQLGDRVAILDAGRVVQEGTPSELAGAPASAFVADLTGAVVLVGTATASAGETVVELEGGGTVASTDPGRGAVAVSVHPWEIGLEPVGSVAAGSARNRLEARVTTVTTLGSRVRVGLEASQPLAAEITASSAARLGVEPGVRFVASWKATATRLVRR